MASLCRLACNDLKMLRVIFLAPPGTSAAFAENGCLLRWRIHASNDARLMTATALRGRATQAAFEFPPSGRLAYIDGMRAIAIVAVVAFHARIPGFGGGFVGVDVFFVISGFLITRQIVSQLLAGRFSAVDFYARRVLRIFPPLLLVTVVTLALAKLFPLLPEESANLAKSAAATAAMVSNYYFTNGTEYFSIKLAVDPLLHTWSLGVEEQYYLLAPASLMLLLALARRYRWRPVPALLISGAATIALSYIVLMVLARSDHRLAFFSIMTRAWQFSLGGMLAIATLNGATIAARLRPIIGAAGFLAIVVPVATYTLHTDYPGFAAALPPTLGALALLASGLGSGSSPLTRLLATRPAVTIGVLSYSWYLWHWPLVELTRTLQIGGDGVWVAVLASLTALLASVPTYLLIERPMKKLRRPDIVHRFGARIVTAGVVGSALIALAALGLAHSGWYLGHMKPLAFSPDPAFEPAPACRQSPSLPHGGTITPCMTGNSDEPAVVFLGDSHAIQLRPVAGWSARDAGRSAGVFGDVRCPPLQSVEVDYTNKHTCAHTVSETLAWLAKPRPQPIAGVVLAARWSYYNGQDTPEGDTTLPQLSWTGPGAVHGYADILKTGLTDFLGSISRDRRVLIVGPLPEFRQPPEQCLQRTQLTGRRPAEVCTVARAAVDLRNREALNVLREVASKFPNARLIDPTEVFCDRERCSPFGPTGLFYYDANHTTELGAQMIYRRFKQDFLWVYGGGS
jgi:peptidoglycan/LPS O-acetylase OafA/YrhL